MPDTAALVTGFFEDTLVLDLLEYVTDYDEERKNELIEEEHINLSGEFLDGYYLYNPVEEAEQYGLTDEPIYTFIDWDAMYTDLEYPSYVVTAKRQFFLEYLKTYTNRQLRMPLFFELENGAVKSIYERMRS